MMFVELVLGLKDVPGMLVKALEPVSGNGGNIVSVLHSRSKKDLVEVNVGFKVKDQVTLNQILEGLKREKVPYREVTVEGRKYYSKKSVSFILVGHVIDQDIQDTIDRLNKIGLVRDVNVRMSDPDTESAVMMRVNLDEDRTVRLINCVEEICKNKKFLLVREVGI
jgi:ACT domain-containing protein